MSFLALSSVSGTLAAIRERSLAKEKKLIEVQSVSKRFGQHWAVSKVSLSIKEGEVFGLLGPNGAGKSTVLKMLMNILKPDSGEISYDGNSIRESDKDRVGYLPEERGLYKDIKINETLLYLASLKNGDTLATKKRLDEWLERFDLMEWKNRTVNTLSKGMSQKVQFIASILHDPDFIFFDEPFSGLDPLSTDMLTDAIMDLAAKGKNIVLSTHNMEIAEKLCTGILVIDHGHTLLYGNLADIKAGYGHNTLAVEYDGTIDLNSISDMVKHVTQFPRLIEMELIDDSYLQSVMRSLFDQAFIRRFEVLSPSLHKIYVEHIGKAAKE